MEPTISFEPNGVRVIPANHNVTGTCGKCGGPIISPMISTNGNPDEWCMDCGARPKKIIAPEFGEVREMQ